MFDSQLMYVGMAGIFHTSDSLAREVNCRVMISESFFFFLRVPAYLQRRSVAQFDFPVAEESPNMQASRYGTQHRWINRITLAGGFALRYALFCMAIEVNASTYFLQVDVHVYLCVTLRSGWCPLR
jgi:hypothetical protein